MLAELSRFKFGVEFIDPGTDLSIYMIFVREYALMDSLIYFKGG